MFYRKNIKIKIFQKSPCTLSVITKQKVQIALNVDKGIRERDIGPKIEKKNFKCGQ